MVTSSERVDGAPILAHKHYGAPSVFISENLLREARRQKGLAHGAIPAVYVLEPGRDLFDHLQ